MIRERLTSASYVLVVCLVVAVPLWFASDGLYSLGLWPLGALLRIVVWIYALVCVHRIIRHLRASPTERMLRMLEDGRRDEEGHLGP